MANQKNVALLGTGIMGSGMAAQLLDAGHELTVWNRTTSKARPLAERGAKLAASPVEAVDGVDFVITALADGGAVREVMEGDDGALVGMGRASVWIQMSTVSLEDVDEFERRSKESGVHFVDAPVLGTKGPAEKGELIVLAAGSSSVLERCQPLFDAVGRRTMSFEKPCHATRLKLVINNWVLGLLGVLAETIAMADALGVNSGDFLDAIAGGALDAGYAHIKGEMMQKREYPTAFPLRLALKDARLIEAAARKHDLEPHVIASVAERFAAAVDKHGDRDMSAVVEVMRTK